MKILVTGGAGFIGANFLIYMVNKYSNYFFVCLDDLTYAGNFSNIERLLEKKNFKFVKGNITDRKFVYNLFEKEKFDWVVNFAAESHVTNSIDNPSLFFESNLMGTQVLLDASLKYDIKKFHQVSTDEVYGSLKIEDKIKKFNEGDLLKPSTPYASSKAGADLLALSYAKTYGLFVTISRCSNNYGPYQFPEKLIPLVIDSVFNNIDICIHGHGEHVRDWIFVEDHVEGIDLVLHKGLMGNIYNFGGNSEKTTLEIIDLLLEKLEDKNHKLVNVNDRKGNDLRYSIDFSKASRELGWKPKHKFEKGIEETIEWYKKNKKWLEDIKTGEYQKKYKG